MRKRTRKRQRKRTRKILKVSFSDKIEEIFFFYRDEPEEKLENGHELNNMFLQFRK